MASAEVGSLRVSLGLDSASFKTGLGKAQKDLQSAGEQFKRIGANIAKVTAGIGLAVGGALAGAAGAVDKVTASIADMAAEAETAGVSFEEFQKLKYVAQQSRVSVEALTDGLKEMQLRADELVQTGVGPAAEAFARIGLTGDQLAKSLENPSAMFDDILARMRDLDKAAQIRVADEIFGGTGGEQFVRLLGSSAEEIAKLKEQFVANGGLIPEEQREKAEALQAALNRVKSALSGIAINGLMDSGLVEWFTKTTPQVIQFAQAVTKYLGPVIQPVFEAVGEAVRGLGAVISAILGTNVGGAGGSVVTFGTVVKRVFEGVVQLITGAFRVIGDILQAFAALLRGDFSAVWEHLGSAVKTFGGTLLRVFETLAPSAVAHIRRMVEGVGRWLTGRLFDVMEGVIRKVRAVSDAFFRLYDAVVGHSYIPDMVTEIGQWMARLDAGMVQPALTATQATKDAFEKLRADVAGIMEGLLTDAERNARDVAAKVAKIREAAAAGVLTQREAAAAEAGIWGENLQTPQAVEIRPIGNPMEDAFRSVQEQIALSRQKFAEAFEYGITSALHGDWHGVLQAIFGDTFRNALQGLGGSLFNALGGGKGLNLGSIFSGLFGGLPGFKDGGTFALSSSGGVA